MASLFISCPLNLCGVLKGRSIKITSTSDLIEGNIKNQQCFFLCSFNLFLILFCKKQISQRNITLLSFSSPLALWIFLTLLSKTHTHLLWTLNELIMWILQHVSLRNPVTPSFVSDTYIFCHHWQHNEPSEIFDSVSDGWKERSPLILFACTLIPISSFIFLKGLQCNLRHVTSGQNTSKVIYVVLTLKWRQELCLMHSTSLSVLWQMIRFCS